MSAVAGSEGVCSITSQGGIRSESSELVQKVATLRAEGIESVAQHISLMILSRIAPDAVAKVARMRLDTMKVEELSKVALTKFALLTMAADQQPEKPFLDEKTTNELSSGWQKAVQKLLYDVLAEPKKFCEEGLRIKVSEYQICKPFAELAIQHGFGHSCYGIPLRYFIEISPNLAEGQKLEFTLVETSDGAKIKRSSFAFNALL